MGRTAHRFLTAAFPVLLLCAGLAWGQALETIRPEEVGMSTARLERLTGALQRYVDDGELAGAVALVARHGHIAYFESVGLADVERKATMRRDTIFRIASQTKAIVSVGIMILQEEGRLLTTDLVSKYIPAYSSTSVAVAREGGGYDVVPANRPISIRDLLTHTAGIGYGYGVAADRWQQAGIHGWYFADRNEPIGATIERIAELPFDAQPGTEWVYGYSTDILGVVIEKASGLSLAEFLRQRIFEPLGMVDTHFYLPPEKRGRLATVYSAGETGDLVRAPEPGAMVGQGAYVDGPRRSYSGGAGLLSTANDYARFLQMLLNGGELGGTRVLSRKSVELMTADHLHDIAFRDGVGFGLGFSVVEDLGSRGVPGTVGEFGWGGAYHSSYWVDPAEDLIVVYFTQLIPAGNRDDHAKLRALVYQSIED
jgi:CubicO group peptidase (beta-lactamase class C family)